jgi:IS30 family transposase
LQHVIFEVVLQVGRPRFPQVVRREFWRGVRTGLSVEGAAVAAGVSITVGRRWFRESGGMSSVDVGASSGRYLSAAEREQIALGLAAGETQADVARRLGRPPCTISREVRRNQASARAGYDHHGTTRLRYVPSVAQDKAEARARRPKPSRLASNARLRREVQTRLERRDSPEQIAGRLRTEFAEDPHMQVSHETIYRSLYVQGKGELRRELTRCLRTGRAIRKPRRRPDARRSRPNDMIMISDRPARPPTGPCPVTGKET